MNQTPTSIPIPSLETSINWKSALKLLLL